MRIIDKVLLQKLSDQARQSPRLRQNLDFHHSHDARGHRFLNAIEPGSYIIPHRHLDPEKDETLIVLSGALGVLTFDEAGRVQKAVHLVAAGDTVGVDLCHNIYHCAISLVAGTVFLEAKSGPYVPLTSEEKAPWAPPENSADVPSYLAGLRSFFL